MTMEKISIEAVVYLAVALGLLAIGFLCTRGTSPHTRRGGPSYEKKRTRRTYGIILMCAAAIPLTLAVSYQFFSGDRDSATLSSADVGTVAANSSPVATNSSSSAPEVTPQPGAQKVESAGTNGDFFPSLPDHASAAQINDLLQQAFALAKQQRFDAALPLVNAVLQADPKNAEAYGLRGNIYAAKEHWDKADKDYQMALQIGGKVVPIEFNVAEIEFHLKKYDEARAGFEGLQQDPDMGDLAKYRVFLCELLGGHEDLAAKKLDALNQIASQPSYYFSNAAWSLYHEKTDDAQSWLSSASRIYSAEKFQRYASALKGLGYPEKLEENALSSPSVSVP